MLLVLPGTALHLLIALWRRDGFAELDFCGCLHEADGIAFGKFFYWID